MPVRTASPSPTKSITASAPPLGLAIPPIPGATQVPVYNITPPPGEPARFGFEVIERHQSKETNPPMWRMWREPRVPEQ